MPCPRKGYNYNRIISGKRSENARQNSPGIHILKDAAPGLLFKEHRVGKIVLFRLCHFRLPAGKLSVAGIEVCPDENYFFP